MRPLKAGLWLLPMALLVACSGEEHQDIKQWMNEQSKDMRGRVPPLPEIKPFPIVSYDATALLDPYRPAKVEPTKKPNSGGGLRPDPNRPKDPLESYPLGSLKMVGTMDLKGKTFAIIQAENKVFRVTAGNYMGLDYGRVMKVTEAEIQLKELVQDTQGNWEEREMTLQLSEQEGKK